MMLDYNPFEQARQSVAQNGGGNFGSMTYLKIEDGETVVLRFLNGLTDYTVYSHGCGLTLYDIPTKLVMDAKAAGQPVICPGCGQPLSDADVVYTRPSVYVIDSHPYTTAPNGQKSNFLCLDSKLNLDQGLITEEHYGGCPVRERNEKNGDVEHPRPRVRVVGAAVLREVDYTQENRAGRPVQVYQGSHDLLGDDGKPQIVIVDQSMYSFWQHIYNALGNGDYSQSICDFDWQIRRIGAGMNTKYDINILNMSQPFPVDMREYDVPDFAAVLRSNGSIAHFTGSGYVFGDDSQQAPQAPQQAPATRPNPSYGRPAVGGTVPWDNVRPS